MVRHCCNGWALLLALALQVHGNSLNTSGLQSSVTMSEVLDSLLSPSVYDPRVRPGADSEEPVVVTVGIKVNSVSSVDQVHMDYTLNIFLRQQWVDPRLAHSMLDHDVSLYYNIQSRLWVPDTFIGNEKEASLHDVTVPNVLLRLSPDGTILYSQRLSVRLACKMDLLKFPMDRQTCQIRLESYGYTASDLILHWTNKTDPILYEKHDLPEFEMRNITTGDCTTTYETGTFTCLYAELDLKRLISYYLIQTYVPSILVVILSWVSFWIDKDSPPARISLGLLTVLTITTQSSGINSRLPRVSYVKAIDVWMSTCLVFVFGAFLEYTIVNTLSRATRKKADRKLDKGSDEKSDTKKGEQVCFKNGTEDSKVRQRHSSQGPPTDKTEHAQSDCLRQLQDPAMFVDKVSRVLFPFVFLVFNLAYWMTYMLIL